ncbi:hypothetical protein DPX16_1208 [Anabarilius grahami]|uniref:Uncharacterized protein n=1 Tax=Anabarilius grahami TaxID=495550 RepID=A0A3N0XVC1_ANAGA|nr:hypothetical protein DPX16_1208 [Anabarilius grahami]
MMEQNGGGHYSNQMYEDALRIRREEERRQSEKEQNEKLRKNSEKIEEKLDAVKISQDEIELEKLFRKYEHSLRMAAFAIGGNVHTGKIIGAFIGGSLGAVAGIYRGPSRAAVGALF